MFEFFFNCSPAAFHKGNWVFLAGWPWWVFALALMAMGVALGALGLRRGRAKLGFRWILITLLQLCAAAILLLLLWRPALIVPFLKPHQNVVALVIDDSRSMGIAERDGTRIEQAAKKISGRFLNDLKSRFQVRLYRFSSSLEPIGALETIRAQGVATRLSPALRAIAAEAASLPVGAVVLFTDGADNTGGVDPGTLAALRNRKIPVHTVGFGRERIENDVELTGVQLPERALPGSRIEAVVKFRQRGFSGRSAKLIFQDGKQTLATRELQLKGEGDEQSVTVLLRVGDAGAKDVQVSLEPLPGEENTLNNYCVRPLLVESRRPRILYVEGEPRWEFKFIRRAVEEDPTLGLVTMLRTTQNKIYRQGIANPKELEEGFPSKPEELFAFQGLIIGGVEAGYFTPAQMELIREFVNRRGGGLLFLAGRFGLAEGGYAKSGFAELLPVTLPDKKQTFFRDPATAELTPAGRESLICRIEEDPQRNFERWKKLPYLANFQETGAAKPGARVLVELQAPGHGRYPLLVTQSYGAGRTALLATAGTWRWQMQQPLEDKSHEAFWQQLLRWLVTDTPGPVISSTPTPVAYDDGAVRFQARVRDLHYLPAMDATVEAHVTGPEGVSTVVDLQPDPLEGGIYAAEWSAPKPGSYVVEVVARRGDGEVGRDAFTFRREDGTAENFRREQNRELLEKLSEQTGGRYYRPHELDRLVSDIQYSEAGISVRETKDLWNMPAVFLLLLGIKGAEWLLRRKWGAV